MKNPRRYLLHALAVAALVPLLPRAAHADGAIDAATLVTDTVGSFGGALYLRHEAMFAGTTSTGHAYRVPCRILSPASPGQRSGLLLFDWPNITAASTAVRRDLPLGRYALTDAFLFGQHLAYATVRTDPAAIGRRWAEGGLNTSSEFIQHPADAFEIVADFVKALRAAPPLVSLVGPVQRTAAFAYSNEGARLRGLVRSPLGRGLFDVSLVGGAGGFLQIPQGNAVIAQRSEAAPSIGTGRVIEFNTETDVLVNEAEHARVDAANLRVYEFAGASHLRQTEAQLFGLPSPETANPADWFPLVRALFTAANAWCDGVPPPPSLWLGAPRDPNIVRDARNNALVRFVGGAPVNTAAHRLPEVAVGERQYLGVDSAFFGVSLLRAIAGSAIDLTGAFTSHEAYVEQVKGHVVELVAQGYLLPSDGDAIIARAEASSIGL